MLVTNNTRSKVLTLAHQLRRTGLSFASAQRKAWKVIRLKHEMKNGEAEFTYTKKDGSKRRAVGTLQTNYERKTNRVYSPLYVRYFDLEKNGFRQFAAANLV